MKRIVAVALLALFGAAVRADVRQTPLTRGIADSLYCALAGCTPTGAFSIKDTLFTLQDDGDTTKQAQFQLSGITAGQTRVFTLPNFNATLATLAGVEALTNKTLTSPAMTGPTTDTLQTSGNIGVFTPPSGTAGLGFYLRDTADEAAGALIENTNAAGTTANSNWRVLADTASGSFVAEGTGRVISRWGQSVAGYIELLATAGNGMSIGPSIAKPLRLGTNSITAITVDGTTQAISLSQDTSLVGKKLSLDGTAQSLAAYTTTGADLSILARSITDTSSSGTVAVNAANAVAAPTLLASSVTIYTDSSELQLTGPPVASTNVTQTRPHTLVLVDPTSAASSITGAFSVCATLGTAATCVGIGGGNINAGGTLTVGGAASVTGTFTPSQTSGVVGTTTNNNANAGSFGEFITALCPGPTTTATITVTIASPGVVTWSGHPFSGTAPRFDACPVVFTTGGALPTGITASTNYWVIPTTISGSTFSIATSVANAIAGTAINTSGTQSGTHTGTAGTVLSTTATKDITGVALTAGDWDCSGSTDFQFGSTTSYTNLEGSISTTAATLGGQDTGFDYETAASIPTATVDMTWGLPNVRRLNSATTNTFMVAQGTFTASTLKAYGTIRCRRMR